jgi:DNA-binding SARP family transcriptional activator
MSLITLRVLGVVQVHRDGQRLRGFESRKALALLCYLALRDQALSRDHIVDLLWPDKDAAHGRGNLSRVVHNLRSLVPGCIETDRHSLALHVTGSDLGEWVPDTQPAESGVWVDSAEFERLVTVGTPACLAAAVKLYRDELMSDIYLSECAEFELWLARAREEWRLRAAQALHRLIHHHVASSQHEPGLSYTWRALELGPWDEQAHRQAMLLLARSGRSRAAIAQYETCRRILASELGIKPAPETTALAERIRAGRIEATARPAPLRADVASKRGTSNLSSEDGMMSAAYDAAWREWLL